MKRGKSSVKSSSIKAKAVKKTVDAKFLKHIESAFSQRAEMLVMNEIKKEIIQNPALMNQLAQAEKGITKGSVEAD